MIMEEKNMAERVELNGQEMEDVVGGHFYWWRADDGTRMCQVTGLGRYVCTADAKDTYAWLKAEHKNDNWSEAKYVDALLASGDFKRA